MLADPDGDLFLATRRAHHIDSSVAGPDGGPPALVLQQPSVESRHVVAAVDDGRLVAVPLAGGEPADIAQLGGAAPPHRSSTAAASSPCRRRRRRSASGVPTPKGLCRGAERPPRRRRVGAAAAPRQWLGLGQRRRYRRGMGHQPAAAPRSGRGLGIILSDQSDDADDENTEEEGGEVLTEINPDDPNAEIVQSDEIDTEGPNRPPIARDDETQTRVDRPIDVDVLANDTDPNGDVLLVHSIEHNRRRCRPDDQPRRAGRAGRAGRRLQRPGLLRLHDHRRPRRHRHRGGPGRGDAVRRHDEPTAGGAQRHRLDPAWTTDDVRRDRQRRRSGR